MVIFYFYLLLIFIIKKPLLHEINCINSSLININSIDRLG